MKHLFLVPLAAATIAAAPGQQQADTSAIVVTGRKLAPEAARERAAEFLRSVGVAEGERTVARWVEPVCPRVLNLAENYAVIVEGRMRVVAEEAGIAAGRAGCRPNIVVSFATDAGAVVRRIAVKSPRSMREISATARGQLNSGTAPVRWWYATEIKGSDGMAQIVGGAPWAGGSGLEGGSALPSAVPTLQQYRSTIVSTQTVRVIKAATIIVDVGAAEGVPLIAVADYVALVAFAEIKPPAAPPPTSILGLFEAPSPPRGLTTGDSSFLRILYRMPHDQRASAQRRILVRDLTAAATR